jgi:hypothetical protein
VPSPDPPPTCVRAPPSPGSNHGSWFFWNFKTELEERWDYVRAVERGWLPADAQEISDELAHACRAERVVLWVLAAVLVLLALGALYLGRARILSAGRALRRYVIDACGETAGNSGGHASLSNGAGKHNEQLL